MIQSFMSLMQDFHFIRPNWLWGLAVLLIVWLFLTNIRRHTRWENFIDKDKLEALRVSGGRYSNSWRWILIFCWVIATIAAAGPTWKQIPSPTVRDQAAMVVVLDLSRSMLAQDQAPDRLTRAKFKLIDILRARGDGQTALIAYAGDPHTVSPLTDDVGTIEALLPALHPQIMPVQGSNTEAAIELAMALLRDAGSARGDILLMTDGVAPEAQRYIRDNLDANFRLSILGIGTIDAVPIPQTNGGFVRDSRGEMVLTRLNREELQILAGVSRGRYVELQPDDSDIDYLLQEDLDTQGQEAEENALLYDIWEDMGYWLVLVLLPIAAWNFRKGALFVLPLIIFFPQESLAFGWNDLWLTKDQQAARLLEQEQPVAAAETFENSDWKATANYRAGSFENAAKGFEQLETAPSFYNQGNALAFAQDFEGAIAAYDKALELDSGFEDAAYNKAIIEQLMQQQEQQQQSQSDENNQENQQDQQDSESEQSQSEQAQSDQQQEQQPGDSSDQQQASDSQQSQQENQEQQQASQQEQQSEEQQQSQQDSEQGESAEEQENQSAEAGAEESEQESSEQEQQLQAMMAEPTPEQLQDSSEQWLRAIPDDPSGLLRRKFDYETQQNRIEQRYMLQLPGNSENERY